TGTGSAAGAYQSRLTRPATARRGTQPPRPESKAVEAGSTPPVPEFEGASHGAGHALLGNDGLEIADDPLLGVELPVEIYGHRDTVLGATHGAGVTTAGAVHRTHGERRRVLRHAGAHHGPATVPDFEGAGLLGGLEWHIDHGPAHHPPKLIGDVPDPGPGHHLRRFTVL